MNNPAQVIFKDLEPSEALEADIRARVEALEHVVPDIQSCRVVVEAPHKHHRHGRLYRVVIDVTVPGRELVVDKAGEGDPAHADPYIAVRDAFHSARRQLHEDARVKRHEVKHHADRRT